MLTFITFINNAFRIYSWILIIYALMSWFPGARQSGLGDFISKLSRPYLDIFDRLIPPIGGLSFSVIIGLVVLQMIQRVVIRLLIGIIL